MKLSYFTIEINSDNRLLNNTLYVFNSTKAIYNDHLYFEIALLLFGVVAVIFVTRLSAGILKIYWIKKTYPVENFEGLKFYQTDLQNAPFSFFRSLFWKNSIPISSDLGRQILKHEMVHMEQKHSWDKMFMELVTAVFWINPFFFAIREELKLIHEYLADKKALKNSDTKAFAQMLLASHFSGDYLPATSPFLSSNLKKRLIMLKKSKTKFSYARKILALPILFLLTFAYLVNAKNKEITEINTMITQQVETLKKDTIKPQSMQKLQSESKKTELKSSIPKLNSQNKKALEMNERLQLKTRELQELAQNKDFTNPRLEQLGKEMSALSGKLDELLKEEPQLRDLDRSLARLEDLLDSESFRLNLKEAELKAGAAAKTLNSPEFKLRIMEAESKAAEGLKMLNKPEFKARIKDAEKKAEEAKKRMDSPAFRKKLKNAEKKALKVAGRFDSPEFKEMMKEVEKKAGEAAINAADFLVILKDKEAGRPVLNTRLFIDGKEISKEEMKILEPNKTNAIWFYKKKEVEREKPEIHIIPKKSEK
jgi:hypothetical protein